MKKLFLLILLLTFLYMPASASAADCINRSTECNITTYPGACSEVTGNDVAIEGCEPSGGCLMYGGSFQNYCARPAASSMCETEGASCSEDTLPNPSKGLSCENSATSGFEGICIKTPLPGGCIENGSYCTESGPLSNCCAGPGHCYNVAQEGFQGKCANEPPPESQGIFPEGGFPNDGPSRPGSSITIPGLSALGIGGIPTGGIGTLNNVLGVAITLLMIAVIILCLFYIVWGGFFWITSEGDKQRLNQARQRIAFAIIGLIVVFLAYGIISIVTNFFHVTPTG